MAHLGRTGLLARVLAQIVDCRVEWGIEAFKSSEAQTGHTMGLLPQGFELLEPISQQGRHHLGAIDQSQTFFRAERNRAPPLLLQHLGCGARGPMSIGPLLHEFTFTEQRLSLIHISEPTRP